MADTKKIRPLGFRVLIEPVKAEESLHMGIIIPVSTGNISYASGKVLTVGSEVTKVKAGELVAHLKYGYDEMTIGGKKLLVVEEGNIIAVFE